MLSILSLHIVFGADVLCLIVFVFTRSFQLCYDFICTENIGAARGNLQEIELDKDERIIQVRGFHWYRNNNCLYLRGKRLY